MKKRHKWFLYAVVVALLALCLTVLYRASVTDYMGVTVGMDDFQIRLCVPGERWYYSFSYYFFKNDWGNPVVVKMSETTYTAQEIRCYSSLWISTDPLAFKCIEKGMSIFEVTELVGIPFGSFTSGLPSSYYRDKDGNEYEIIWINTSGVYCAARMTKNGSIMFEETTQ